MASFRSPPCVNRSEANVWSIEEANPYVGKAIRCSLGFVQTVTPDAAQAIVDERNVRGPFVSLADWGKRCAPFLSRDQMEWLVLSGALDCVCKSRRRALWSLPSLRLFTGGKQVASVDAEGQQVMALPVPPLLPPGLPDFGREARFSHQFAAIGFGEDGHPMRWRRDALTAAGVLPCAALQDVSDGHEVRVAGWVLRPHRPPTPSGQVWVFFTLEDETGLAHVTVSPDVYEETGPALFGSVALVVCGRAQKRGTGILLFAQTVSPQE